MFSQGYARTNMLAGLGPSHSLPAATRATGELLKQRYTYAISDTPGSTTSGVPTLDIA